MKSKKLVAFDDLLVAMGLARLQDLLIVNPGADLQEVPFQILWQVSSNMAKMRFLDGKICKWLF